MWSQIAGAFWWLYKFFRPEKAAYETILARYERTLATQQTNFDAREKKLNEEFDAREKTLKEDLTALRREAARSRAAEAACREQMAQLQQQIWELMAVINAMDAVRKLREDPDFQRRTAEQVRLLFKPEPPHADPSGGG